PVVAVPANATKVVAPMPGKIVDVKVKVGQTIKEGDLLAVLEAMKMENEIMAPAAGKVVSVSVSGGTSVNTGDILVSIG
ncbi:MAG: biotin/lipoyl-containing protein, partial [Oscillospiraceae bacterium]